MNNSILSQLQWNAEAGALTFQDVRYLLIRPETLAQFQQAVEAEVGAERAGELMYAGGFMGGQLSGQRYKEAFGLTERQAVEFMCRMGGEIGWGRFELRELDAVSQRIEVDVYDSPFAQAYLRLPTSGPPSAHPVCHLTRGVLGGLVSGLSSQEVRAGETRCLAQGHPSCHFEIQAIP